MTRMTAKYAGALKLGISKSAEAEELYAELSKHGWQWDSKQGVWYQPIDVPADPPSELLRVRVWCDAEIVDEAADEVSGSMQKRGFKVVERSQTYPCRPPKQLEARVYLTFALPDKKRNLEN